MLLWSSFSQHPCMGGEVPETNGMCPLGVSIPLLDHTLGSQDMGISSSNGPSLLPGPVWTSSASVCTPGQRWWRGSCLERMWLKLGHGGELFPCMYMRPLLFGMELCLLREEEVAVFL